MKGSFDRAPRPGSCGAKTSQLFARHQSRSVGTLLRRNRQSEQRPIAQRAELGADLRAPMPSFVYTFSSLPAFVKQRRRSLGFGHSVLLLRKITSNCTLILTKWCDARVSERFHVSSRSRTTYAGTQL